MKIGKWLKKTGSYANRVAELQDKIINYFKGSVKRENLTGNQVKEALTEQEINDYYRNMSFLNMMTGDLYAQFLKNPYMLDNWGSWWQKNAGSIKRELYKATHDDDVIIITRHPIDVFRMSDFKNITSCHSPLSRTGAYEQEYKCAVAEAHGHGAVAYVVDREELLDEYGVNTIEEVERQIQDADHELFYDDERVNDGPIEPKYRLRLRQMRYYDENDIQGTEIAVPERRMYPQGLPGLVDRVMKWARENQKDIMANAPQSTGVPGALDMNKFIKFGGSYEDNYAEYLLADLFANQFSAFVGRPAQDTETEDELESALSLDVVNTMNQEIGMIQTAFNNDYKYCKVNGEAIDEDGSIGLDIDTRVRFQWSVDEWTGLPNPTEMRYCIDDIKESGEGAYQNEEGVWTNAYLQSDNSTIVRIGDQIIAHIVLSPMHLIGMDNFFQYISMGAEGFAEYCASLRKFDRNKAQFLRQSIENYFKREGYIEGGEMIALGREIEDGEWRWSEWGTDAIGDEYEGFDEISAEMTVAIPKLESVRPVDDSFLGRGIPLLDFLAQAAVQRAVTIELRRRILENPRQSVETEYYLPFRIVSVSAAPNTDEIYVRLEFTLPYDSNNEMVSLMKEVLEEVTEEEVTAMLENTIKQILQSKIYENKKRDAAWALKRWKNNFI